MVTTYRNIVLAICLTGTVAFGQKAMENTLRSPEELYAYANGLYSRKFYDMALDELNSFIERFPENERIESIRLLKADCLYKLGKKDEFIQESEEFRKKYPANDYSDEFATRAGDWLYRDGKYDKSLEVYASLLQSKRESIKEKAMYFIGQCLLQLDQKEKAVAYCRQLADMPLEKKYEYRYYAASEYADGLFRSKNYADALKYYEKIRGNHDAPDAISEKAIYNVGVISYMMHRNNEALLALEECLGRFPNGIFAKSAKKYRIYIIFAKGEYENAIKCISEWRISYPDEADWQIDYYQGEALYYIKRYDDAVPFLQRVEADTRAPDEERKNGCFLASYCLLMARHYAAAEQKCREYIDLYPRTAHVGQVLVWLGYACDAQEKWEASIEAYKRVLALFAEDAALVNEASSSLLHIYEKHEKWIEASLLLHGLAEKADGKSRSNLYLQAALFELRAEKKNDAKNDLLKSIENVPEKETARKVQKILYGIYYSEKDYPNALKCLVALLEDSPADEIANLHYFISVLHFNMGNSQEAEKEITLALENGRLGREENAHALMMLAYIRFAQNNPQNTVAVLDRIFALEQTDIVQYMDEAFLDKAAGTYLEQRKLEEAAKIYQLEMAMPNISAGTIADARLKLVKNCLIPCGKLQEAAASLKQLVFEFDKDPKILETVNKSEVLSYSSETLLKLEKYDEARVCAEKVIGDANAESRDRARATYVLAFIRLNVEKRTKEANNLATQGFILTPDNTYSPLLMVISMQAFEALGEHQKAENVLQELSQNFSAWLAEHPEVKRQK